MASRALVVSSRTLAKPRPGQLSKPSSRPLAKPPEKVIELVPKGSPGEKVQTARPSRSGPSGGGTAASRTDEDQDQTSPGRGGEEEKKASAKGVVRSSAVVQMLMSLGVGEDEAVQMVLSNQLSQSNPRVMQSGATLSRRDGGTGFGKGGGGGGGGGQRRVRPGAEAKPAQTKRIRPQLPAPAGSAARPQLPAPAESAARPQLPAPAGSAARPQLPAPAGSAALLAPSGGSPGQRPALPAPSGGSPVQRPALPAPSGGSPVASPATEASMTDEPTAEPPSSYAGIKASFLVRALENVARRAAQPIDRRKKMDDRADEAFRSALFRGEVGKAIDALASNQIEFETPQERKETFSWIERMLRKIQ